jgi:acyl-CoA thioester hydrolase
VKKVDDWLIAGPDLVEAASGALEHHRPIGDAPKTAQGEVLVYRHRVRYHETDAQHVVFNSRYLEFTDVAMTEYFRGLGWQWAQLVAIGCDPVVASTHIDYKEPAAFDDDLGVFVRLGEVGRSSFRLIFSIRRIDDDVELAVIESAYVNFDPETKSSRPLPDSVRERMLAHRQGASRDDI